MQQTRRHCGRRCGVDRISCDIGCDRRSSRSKELRVAVMCISRHSGCGGVIEFRCADDARQKQQHQQQHSRNCIGNDSSCSCNNNIRLCCVGSGDASCEAGAHRLEWRPISRKSNISCCVGSGDSSFDPGAHRLEWRRRCAASADAADKETLREAVQRGQDQPQHRLRQAQQGTSSGSDMHQQAQQLRAAARECWNFGELRLQNNRLQQQQQQQQQQQPMQTAWRRQRQHHLR